MGYPFPQGFAGSNPARSTFTATHSTLEELLAVAQNMMSNGNAESTIECTLRRLKFLNKNTSLGIPQIVKEYIKNYEASNAYKEGLAMAYNRYVVFYKLNWEIPYFQKEERLPNVPSTEEANIIISSFQKKWATIFTILKETGLRPIELHRTVLKTIDLEKGTINAKGCQKRKPKNPQTNRRNTLITKNIHFKQQKHTIIPKLRRYVPSIDKEHRYSMSVRYLHEWIRVLTIKYNADKANFSI